MPDDKKTTSEPWKKIADMWDTYFAPPSRVSKNEAAKYSEWLGRLNSEKKPMQALILGATPEIRDALKEHGYRTTVLDINLEMILAMDTLMSQPRGSDIIVKSDWLDNPLQSGYYDIILGDAVLPNIRWHERKTLLTEVKRLLKPGGCFITRSFCVPKDKPYRDIDEILAHFSKKEPTFRTSLELVLELQILSYDQKDHLGTFTVPKEMLKRLRDESGFSRYGKNLERLLGMVWDFWCTGFIDKVFVYAYRDEEEDDYRRYFSIIETFETDDHPYSKITPMYILRKDA
ncbi:MAG: class I SAM-dependent methyltransferase [archaeon]